MINWIIQNESGTENFDIDYHMSDNMHLHLSH